MKSSGPHLKVVNSPSLLIDGPLKQRAPSRKLRKQKPINTSSFLEAVRCLAVHPPTLKPQSFVMKGQLRVLLRLFEAKCVAFYRLVEHLDVFAVDVAVGRRIEHLRAVSRNGGIVGDAAVFWAIQKSPDSWAFAVHDQKQTLGVILVSEPSRSCSLEMMGTLAEQFNLAFRFGEVGKVIRRQQSEIENAVSSIKRLEGSRDRIWSHVSEELRSPLAVLRTHLSMLAEHPMKNGALDLSNSINACHRSAAKLQESIDSLILSSRLMQGHMKLNRRPFGLKQLLGDCTERLQQFREFREGCVEVDCRSEHFIRGDRTKLFEVFSSVMEYGLLTSSDNRFSLRLTQQPHSSVQIEISCKKALNSGQGFQIISQLKAAKKAIEMHGGYLDETSRRDTFQIRISLPVFLGRTSFSKETSRKKSDSRILLLEDDIDCRDALQELLELEGYRVKALSSVDEALEWLQVEEPSLVLLDLWLGESRGIEVLHYIRQDRMLTKLPVFLVSGSRHLASVTYGHGIDRIDGFFEKPYPLARLLSQISRYVIPSGESRVAGNHKSSGETPLRVVQG